MPLPPSVLLAKAMLDETLAQEPQTGKRDMTPFSALAKSLGVPMTMIEAKATTGKVEIHRRHADVWLCIDGTATIRCDGTAPDATVRVKDGVANEYELRGDAIEGGVDHALLAGDWLFIPAGQPHQLIAPDYARFIVVKVLAEIVASLPPQTHA